MTSWEFLLILYGTPAVFLAAASVVPVPTGETDVEADYSFPSTADAFIPSLMPREGLYSESGVMKCRLYRFIYASSSSLSRVNQYHLKICFQSVRKYLANSK